MEINTITLDHSVDPKTSNASIGSNASFQVAYAKVLDENYAPVGRDIAPTHLPCEQNSPPPSDRSAHTVRAGETLYGIVHTRLATMGMDANPKSVMQGVKQLAQANDIRNPDRVYVGQKIDVTALASSSSRQTTPLASGIDRSAAANGIRPSHQRNSPESPPEIGAQLADEDAAATPLTIAALPPTLVRDDTADVVDVDSGPPLAARVAALYEQNAPIATETPAESSGALPDIVYKGVVGKVLDAMPLDPSTRTGLQQANSVVGSAFTGRSLGALAGLGGPLLTVAGLIWGIFASRHIDAAATGQPKPEGNPKPLADATQTTQNKPPEALN